MATQKLPDWPNRQISVPTPGSREVRSISPAAAAQLAAELRRRIKGEVRFDKGSRALYATDASNYRQPPIGVVLPRETEDAVQTIAAARRFNAPLLSRGGGTSLAGQCCNVAVVVDYSKYLNHVIHIDAKRRLATVQPGCVLDDLRDAAQAHGLTFGPDPATHRHCTLGGMLGNNSCGVHSLLSAKHHLGLRTSDNTAGLEVVTYDGARFRVGATSPEELERIIRAGGRRGEIYAAMKSLRDRYASAIRRRFPSLPRRVSGYNLDELLPENGFNVARSLIGSEGTLATILEATVHLVPLPRARSLVVFGYPNVFFAADHVTDILPFQPTGLEGLDHRLIEYVRRKGSATANLKLLPEGNGFLLVEFGGESKEDSDDQARRCMQMLRKQPNPPSMRLYDDPETEQEIWDVREGGLGATAFVPSLPDMWPGWEDSAVPPSAVGNYLRDLGRLFTKYDYEPSVYGHFGQGCIHCRIGFDLYTTGGIARFRSFMNDAADLVLHYGGSLSGEHGDGQSRGELLTKMFGEELIAAFREFKRIWDPGWKMNPGKVIDANPITSNLRLGPEYNPQQTSTYFEYPGDHNAFSRAVLRCVGVGKCRNHGGQVMCPSYMATREEMHSTRGRARLLWEMLNGELKHDGWKSEPVHDALDLCLACKGCKADCPVNVDMATYKAEFFAHYYKSRLRPRHAYAMGWIDRWSSVASGIPGIVNALAKTPPLAALAKWAAGIAPQRELPVFASEPFRVWFRRRGVRRRDCPQVILWPDTFTNHFDPEIGIAAVEVLENAGFRVCIPRKRLCCGRPLYDFGMLDRAKAQLLDILETLRPEIRAGIPVIGLEPSCIAVFRDELGSMFPKDEDARRLRQQSFLFSEFLDRQAPRYRLPRLPRRAVLHGHCHHKYLTQMKDEDAILDRLEIEAQAPEPGCCGMAGSFGFEKGRHYEVSIQCAERLLLPAVRLADEQTLVIADGFSCREQIRQTTNRRPLHLAQVIQLALHDGRNTNG